MKIIKYLFFSFLLFFSFCFVKAGAIAVTTTTKPMAIASAVGLSLPQKTIQTATTNTNASTALNSQAATITANSQATGTIFVFNNVTLTEYYDPTGIYYYTGILSNHTMTDYFVAMPYHLFDFLTKTYHGHFPGYDPSRGILEIPGQPLNAQETNKTGNEKITQMYLVSLITGRSYVCSQTFSQAQTTTSSQSSFKTFVHNGPLMRTKKEPIFNLFAMYAPFPNLQGRFCQTLADLIERTIKTYDTATGATIDLAITQKEEPQRFAMTTPQPKIKLSTLKTGKNYILQNVRFKELLDPTGIYVYEALWTHRDTEEKSPIHIDYVIFMTPSLFALYDQHDHYPVYNYAHTKHKTSAFLGQQLNQMYNNESVTFAVSLVTGNCYQLIDLDTQSSATFPTLSSETKNASIILKPLITTSDRSAKLYQEHFAPYQNYAGQVSTNFISAVTAALQKRNSQKTAVNGQSQTTTNTTSDSSSILSGNSSDDSNAANNSANTDISSTTSSSATAFGSSPDASSLFGATTNASSTDSSDDATIANASDDNASTDGATTVFSASFSSGSESGGFSDDEDDDESESVFGGSSGTTSSPFDASSASPVANNTDTDMSDSFSPITSPAYNADSTDDSFSSYTSPNSTISSYGSGSFEQQSTQTNDTSFDANTNQTTEPSLLAESSEEKSEEQALDTIGVKQTDFETGNGNVNYLN